jgi:hypothetical protein
MCAVVAGERVESAGFAGAIADLARLAVGTRSPAAGFIGREAGFMNHLAGQERVGLLGSRVYHDDGCARTRDTGFVRDIRLNLVCALCQQRMEHTIRVDAFDWRALGCQPGETGFVYIHCNEWQRLELAEHARARAPDAVACIALHTCDFGTLALYG